jgi:hypothetical protein
MPLKMVSLKQEVEDKNGWRILSIGTFKKIEKLSNRSKKDRKIFFFLSFLFSLSSLSISSVNIEVRNIIADQNIAEIIKNIQ